MKTYVLEGTMTALTSLSHIGESSGINSRLRREKIAQLDGSVEEVPIVSGNSIRGMLRDRGMLHMMRRLGYDVNEESGEVRGISLSAFYFLFSGGALTDDKGRGLDVDRAREWKRLVPLVSLFGGAMGNQIMPGKVKVGKLVPICKETQHLLPEEYQEKQHPISIWEMVQEEPYTRKDDEKNEHLRQLIAPEARKLLEAKAAAERQKTDKDDAAKGTGQKQQMRYFVETIAAGTRFYWDVALDDVSDVEFDAFAVALAEFGRMPYLGGKSGIGHGKMRLEFQNWLNVEPRITPLRGAALDVGIGQKYLAYLDRNVEQIRSLINGLA